MPDQSRILAMVDLLVDEHRHLDLDSIAEHAARQVARMTRAEFAAVTLRTDGVTIRSTYPSDEPVDPEAWTISSAIKTSSVTGEVEIVGPIDGAFTQLDSWIVDVIARRTEGQLATVELHEERLAARQAVNDSHLAGAMQRALVSTHHIQLETIEAAGTLKPARRVGGDVFDLLVVDGILLAVVADVSGKGAPAAMLTSAVLTSVQQHAEALGAEPGQILVAVERTLRSVLERAERLVTLALVAVDPVTGATRIASAGHHPIMLSSAQQVRSVAASSPPLGVGAIVDAEVSCQLADGDQLLLGSDGIVDQRNLSGVPLGMETLSGILGAQRGVPSTEAVGRIQASVCGYAADTEQDDDQAVVVITRTAPPRVWRSVHSAPDLRFEAAEDHLAQACRAAQAWLDGDTAMRVHLGLHELMVNIRKHGYGSAAGDIEVTIEVTSKAMRVAVRDHGVALPPSALEARLDGALLSESGGYGLQIIHGAFDQVEYSRTDGHNEWKLSVHSRKPPPP